MASEPLVAVEGLTKHYYEQNGLLDRLLGREPTAVRAVDGISFDIQPGETLGLVGESGCGKSTAGETMLCLREPTDGVVRFDGENVYDLDRNGLSNFRRRAGIVFQDPFSSLDPRMTAGEIIREPLVIHGKPDANGDGGADSLSARQRERASELTERVGLSASQLDRYPHEFSGGQRQRIGIARALALEPEFVVLDEPVSALDVSVQAQILNLLEDLQEEFGLTYLFITHDLSVVRHICDRVAVMYLGEIVEVGPVDELFDDPKHPYTEALLESVPRPDASEHGRRVDAIEGDVPSPRNPPSGCRFRTRCPVVIPPDDVDIEQAAYREVMNLRDRIERDDLNVDAIWDTVDASREDVEAFERECRSRLFEHDLSGENEAAVEDAIAALANGDRVGAENRLRERFASVCERVSPVLQDGSHPAACHRYEQPEERAISHPPSRR